MKIKTIALATILSGSLFAASAYAASGFMLINHIDALGISKVSCTKGATLKPTVAFRVPWAFLKNQFLKGQETATCTFYSADRKTPYGSGIITLSSSDTIGTISNVQKSTGYNVTIDPTTNTGPSLTVTLSKA
jgi:hypothetical protein